MRCQLVRFSLMPPQTGSHTRITMWSSKSNVNNIYMLPYTKEEQNSPQIRIYNWHLSCAHLMFKHSHIIGVNHSSLNICVWFLPIDFTQIIIFFSLSLHLKSFPPFGCSVCQTVNSVLDRIFCYEEQQQQQEQRILGVRIVVIFKS